MNRVQFKMELTEAPLILLCGLFGATGTLTFSTSVIISTQPGDAVALYFTFPASVAILNTVLQQRLSQFCTFVFICISHLAGVVYVSQPSFIFDRQNEAFLDNSNVGRCGIILVLSSSLTIGLQFTLQNYKCIHQTTHHLLRHYSFGFMLILSTLLCLYIDTISLYLPASFLLYFPSILTGILYFLCYWFTRLAVFSKSPVIVSTTMTLEVATTYFVQLLFLIFHLKVTVGGALITVSCVRVALWKFYENVNVLNCHDDDKVGELIPYSGRLHILAQLVFSKQNLNIWS